MKNMSRILSVLIMFALMLQCMAGTVKAEQTDIQAIEPITKTRINPLYQGVITEDMLVKPEDCPALTDEEPVYHTSKSAAAQEMRDEMIARQAVVSFGFCTDTYSKEIGNQLFDEFFAMAIAHTGMPKEGDSIRWQWGGYKSGLEGYIQNDLYYLTFSYTLTYYTTAEQEAQLDSAVSTLLNSLDLDGKSDYEQVCAIYDYICANITYDYDHLDIEEYTLKYSAYAALVNKTAVCQGYALLFYRLALEQGIDARLIAGLGNGGAHGWNIVELDDLYYNLDSTWDAGAIEYDYFLKNDANFYGHERYAEYTTESFYADYPMAENDYTITPSEPEHQHTSGQSVRENEVSASCEAEGSYDEVVYCTECGEELSREPQKIAPLGHDMGEWETTKAVTCTEDGTKRRDCSRCDHFETEVIASAGHKYESVATAPTCADKGYTTHTCSICGDTYTDAENAALGHNMGAWTTTKAATCTENGTKRRDCSRCDHFETEVIASAGHKYESVVTAPTCAEKGYTTHTCSICGDTYTDTEVAELGHDMGEWETTKAATCTEDGAKRSDCSRCDHVETEIITSAGHKYESVVTDPACEEKGYTTHTCSVCGDTYTDAENAALGHNMGTWTTTKAATCTEDGAKRRDCSRCDHVETDVIASAGHKYESVVTAPTCEDKGYTTHTCSVCGDAYTDSENAALGHKMGAWETTKAATCTEDGAKRRDCSRCDHFETEVIASAGHKYESVVTAPTCVEKGYTIHTCSVCDESYVDTYVDATGKHSYTDDKDASCNICGYERQIAVASVPVYRLYNEYTGEHLMTGSAAEKDLLVSVGWHLDGVAWNAPEEGTPVYRLYNPYDDWHTYTISEEEKETMMAAGWLLDGVVSHSAPANGKPIYRLFNPYELKNFHLFTASEEERGMLVAAGWILEGIAWYAVG